MRVQKTDNTSFKSFRVDAKGKKSLSKFVEATSDEARPDVEKMLIDFKAKMDEYANILDSSPQTKGIDILLTETASDASHWEDVPTLYLKKENSYLSESLILNNFSSSPYDKKTHPFKLDIPTIQKRSEFIVESSKKWFYDNLARVSKSSEVETKSTPMEIVKNIFG